MAKAKETPFDPNKTHILIDEDDNVHPMRIFPGALLGCMSNSKKRPNFVDLWIVSSVPGISREQVKVMSVKNLVDAANKGPAAGQDKSR